MRKVLIQDIADEMGLSRNTVAKALKNNSGVLAETRKKVINTAYKMGYTKLSQNALEEVEVEKQAEDIHKYVVMIGTVSEDDFWNGIMVGISNEINKNHGSCVVNFINVHDEEALILPSNLIHDGCNGIICISVFKREYTQKMIELEIPIVFLDSPVRKPPYHFTHDIIMIEGEQSIYEITSDLIKRGCKRLGFIGDITYCQSIYDRWKGFSAAVRDAELELLEQFCFTEHVEGRYYKEEELVQKLNKLAEIPDAFVCANDKIAIMVIQYFKRKGYNVPEDIAVTGFDNKKEGLILEPHITTVDTANIELGSRLVKQLFFKIDNPYMRAEVITVTTKVCFRESSDKK